nr:MAG TPA: hypothetical protein [Caudoviricetes sp.]
MSRKTKKRAPISTVNRQGWQKYAYRGDVSKATRSELTPIIQRAAHVANERLRALERAGETGGAYKMAQTYLSLYGRSRFSEGNKILKNMRYGRLQATYRELREFLSAESSTISGISRIHKSRYDTAVQRGFTGTENEWNTAVVKYFAEVKEGLFSSDTVYNALTNQSGMSLDYLDKVIAKDRKLKARGKQGLDISDALMEIAKLKSRKKPKKSK